MGAKNPCTNERLMKLTAFYIIYYGLLTLLFILSCKILTRDPATNLTPTRQAHLSSPYMTVQPISDISEYISRSERKNKIKIPLTQTNNKWSDADYYTGLGIVDKMKEYVTSFENDSEDRACSSETKSNFVKSSTSNSYGCKPYKNYNWITNNTNCGTNFGFDTLNPCFIVSLNRIINWEMLGLTNSTFQKWKQEGKQTGLDNLVFDSISDVDGKYGHFHCFEFADNVQAPGMPDYNKPLTGADSTATIEWIEEKFYFKDDASSAVKDEMDRTSYYNTIPSYFFPYTGKGSEFDKPLGLKRKPFLVMKLKLKPAKFDSVKNTSGKATSHFECNAYAENLISSYLVKENVGGVEKNKLIWKDGIARNGQFSQFSFGVEWSV